MRFLRWLGSQAMSSFAHWLGHAVGALVIFLLYAAAKTIKDQTTLANYLTHPEELISAAMVTLLLTTCIALFRIVIKQRRMLTSFGVRLFSKHDTPEVKKSDWAAVCADIKRASDEHSPLWILGATGKETFSSPTSPLFDALRTFSGEIKVLLVRPNSVAFDHRCNSLGLSKDNYTGDILDSIEYCKELVTKKGRSVELKLYESPPIWKMFLTNRVLWVQYYKPGEHVDKTPIYCFKYVGTESTLFDGFRTVFQKRWSHDASKNVQLEGFVRSTWQALC